MKYRDEDKRIPRCQALPYYLYCLRPSALSSFASVPV